MKITTIGLTTLLGTLISLSAIERPGDAKSTDQLPIKPAQPQGGILGDDQKAAPKAQAVPEARVAYLGVGGEAAGEALLMHLDIESGLLLTTVDPSSPAGLAGLKENDIIISVDGGKLTDQDSLRETLAAQKPGAEVNLKLLRRGKSIEQKVTLGDAPAVREIEPQALVPNQAADMNRLLNQRLGNGLDGLGNAELQKELMEQLEKAFGQIAPNGQKGGGVQQLRLDLGGERLNAKDFKMGIRGVGAMRFEDEEGSIQMKTTDGQRELTIRDKEGELLFEGPYDTDIDKAAVPEEYRERVERFDTGNGGIFKLKLNGRNHFEKEKKEAEQKKGQ